jgi:hypothetical protein
VYDRFISKVYWMFQTYSKLKFILASYYIVWFSIFNWIWFTYILFSLLFIFNWIWFTISHRFYILSFLYTLICYFIRFDVI